jgi:ABC-type multidrug transport system fused ATPase/permease subunit
MTTQMVLNDEKKDIISPLLTRPTHVDNEQSVLSIKNSKINGTYVISFDENIFKSITISFENINYTIGQTTDIKYYQKWKKLFSYCKPIQNKQILFDLSGIFTPGMNAILGIVSSLLMKKTNQFFSLIGPTGCGKTTLLDILADRKDSHGLTGNVFVSGKSRPECFKYTVGYVIQDGMR